MPIRIPESLPAAEVLIKENIFVMSEIRAMTQDIRPLKIAILNLMPTKIVTETQFLRLLSNTPLQIDITLLRTATHTSKNTPFGHLESFYKTFDDIKQEKFDGLIITGAPVENLPFEEVNYWDELCSIIDWAKSNVYSTMYICWGAQAALFHNYGIGKKQLPEKMFGVFRHCTLSPSHPLIRGFDERFYAPHSRYTDISVEDVMACKDLIPLAVSDEAGLYMICSEDGREVYITGHAEYDIDTLSKEYNRDIEKNKFISIPKNYFPNDDPCLPPKNIWRAHAHLLFSNWLNYFVYQSTPYNIEEIH
ncbi:MAG: homoserine O-succinyltransferase [Clostridiales bacterium GWF2_38_85]|nr:MAG: homoserine O-succinyltransferase [Clostridiales bacterium GWF2_38_85]HBL83815.1 homoserine O-succinyltransferase [Clostridiales bacterium]